MDLGQHLLRQMAFSRGAYGPGRRTKGVIDHIRKELIEIEAGGGEPDEWVDVVILAFDGLTRALQYHPNDTRDWRPGNAANAAIELLRQKQDANEIRDWPDWRSADPDKAIEHDRSKD